MLKKWNGYVLSDEECLLIETFWKYGPLWWMTTWEISKESGLKIDSVKNLLSQRHTDAFDGLIEKRFSSQKCADVFQLSFWPREKIRREK